MSFKKITKFAIVNNNLEITIETGETINLREYQKCLGWTDEIVSISHVDGRPKIDIYTNELPGRPAPGTVVIDCRGIAEPMPFLAE